MLRIVFNRFVYLLLTSIAIVLFLTACIIVPHPMTRHITGMNGPVKKGIDRSFIHAEVTKADEVRDKLKEFDTGFVHERLFWARWCDSHVGITAGFGGPGAAAGGTGRLWGARNLFVRFDDKGTVTSAREFKDSELYAVLTAWVNEANPPALDVSKPVSLIATRHRMQQPKYGNIVLSADEITYTEDDNPTRGFTLKPEEILSVDSATVQGNDLEPRLTGQTFHFAAKTFVGSKLTVDMYARDLMDFVIYLRDHRTQIH